MLVYWAFDMVAVDWIRLVIETDLLIGMLNRLVYCVERECCLDTLGVGSGSIS